MMRLHHVVETIGPLSLNYVLTGNTTHHPSTRPGVPAAIFDRGLH